MEKKQDRAEKIIFTDTPLKLDCGAALSNFTIAYKTYGTLNKAKNNVILICHALSGDQYAAFENPITGKKGWWHRMVGSGKPIDTDRFYVICQNTLGGCHGSSGPTSTNPETGEPYGLTFPIVTMADMVRAQKRLMDKLGLKDIFCVIGGSMGGMQVLQWAADYGNQLGCVVPIASTARHSAQNIAFHEVGRQAILGDPNWEQGRYYEKNLRPTKGLGIARMAAHITYLSEEALHRKFGRSLQDRKTITYGFDADFQIESYLRHKGSSFVDYFDANSYLYITRAMDYFDLASTHKGILSKAFLKLGKDTHFCVISFTSDWLYPTHESRHIVHALHAAGAKVSFVEIDTDKGHDAFLLEEQELFSTLNGFLNANAKKWGI